MTRELTRAAQWPGPDWLELDEIVTDEVIGSEVLRVKIWDETAGSSTPTTGAHRPAVRPVGGRAGALRARGDAGGRGQRPRRGREPGAARLRREAHAGLRRRCRTSTGRRCCSRPTTPTTPSAPPAGRAPLAFLPVLVGGLVLLWLAQAPLAWRLATRLRFDARRARAAARRGAGRRRPRAPTARRRPARRRRAGPERGVLHAHRRGGTAVRGRPPRHRGCAARARGRPAPLGARAAQPHRDHHPAGPAPAAAAGEPQGPGRTARGPRRAR